MSQQNYIQIQNVIFFKIRFLFRSETYGEMLTLQIKKLLFHPTPLGDSTDAALSFSH